MAVPAHDTRDWEFAKKFGLPIVEVVKGGDVDRTKRLYRLWPPACMVNSGFLNGLTVDRGQEDDHRRGWKRTAWASEKVNYKLRDWVFSRQRYWGEPIPMVKCDEVRLACPLPEEQLPLTPAGRRQTMSRTDGRRVPAGPP